MQQSVRTVIILREDLRDCEAPAISHCLERGNFSLLSGGLSHFAIVMEHPATPCCSLQFIFVS